MSQAWNISYLSTYLHIGTYLPTYLLYLPTYLPTVPTVSTYVVVVLILHCHCIYLFIVSLLVAFYALDYCKSCYCLRTLRQLDCLNGVEVVAGFMNDEYLEVDMGGSTANCMTLQCNFPMASIVDCVQIGGVRSGGVAIDGSGSGSFDYDTLWSLLSLFLFIIIPYIIYWMKKWCTQHAAQMA